LEAPDCLNVTTEMPAAVHPAFILAHVAWAILSRVRNFLTRGEMSPFKLRQSSGAEDINQLTGEELR
jgi:hypothetical protein